MQRPWSDDFDREPYVIEELMPIVPGKAERQKISGSVTVVYDIGTDGKPANIRIVKSSNEMFNKATVKAIKNMRYLPAIVDGEIVETRGVKRKVNYKL